MSDREILFQDLRIIHELVTSEEPSMALQHIGEVFEGEERELLISIFGLEDLAREEE